MSISEILAYSAFGLFFLSFFLAIEGIGFDRLFGSHTRQFHWHHNVAIAAVVIIVAHVLYELWKMGADWLMLFKLNDPALALAWGAVTLLATAFISAWMARRFGHRKWLKIHWLVLPAITLAAAHGAMFAENPIVTWTLAILAVLALLPLLKYLPQSAKKRYRARCSAREPGGIVRLEIEGPMHKTFVAGQIVSLRFCGPAFSKAWHPFSVASCDDGLQVMIRPVGRDTKQLSALNEVKVEVRGPFRDFDRMDQHDMIWIGGGIGIAPFIGMAQHPAEAPPEQRIRLLYFHRRVDPPLHPEVFADYASHHPGFEWHEVIHPDPDSNPQALLADTLQSLPDAHILVCGPPAFTRWIRSQLAQNDIPESRIQADEWIG